MKAWCPNDICGAIPGKEGEQLLERLARYREHCNRSSRFCLGASVDLPKCFDRLSPAMAVMMALKMGLPEEIGHLILDFM